MTTWNHISTTESNKMSPSCNNAVKLAKARVSSSNNNNKKNPAKSNRIISLPFLAGWGWCWSCCIFFLNMNIVPYFSLFWIILIMYLWGAQLVLAIPSEWLDGYHCVSSLSGVLRSSAAGGLCSEWSGRQSVQPQPHNPSPQVCECDFIIIAQIHILYA